MDKEKDIQGIAKALYGHYCGQDECGKCKQPNCLSYKQAQRIVNMGYGNIPQVLTEFVEKLKKKATWWDTETCDDDYYNLCVGLYNIDKILEEFKNERL